MGFETEHHSLISDHGQVSQIVLASRYFTRSALVTNGDDSSTGEVLDHVIPGSAFTGDEEKVFGKGEIIEKWVRFRVTIDQNTGQVLSDFDPLQEIGQGIEITRIMEPNSGRKTPLAVQVDCMRDLGGHYLHEVCTLGSLKIAGITSNRFGTGIVPGTGIAEPGTFPLERTGLLSGK